MYDLNKIIVFLFFIILLFYMLRLSFFIKQKGNSQTYTFSILFSGILLATIASLFDMISPVFSNKATMLTIKTGFTLGSVLYISGVVLWGNYTKKIIENFEELALKDSMTEMFNRKGMEKIYKLISASQKPFYLGICDLDRLKEINDRFGHLQGDKYIEGSAKIIVDVVGARGYVGRIGGDEFIMILEHMEVQEMNQIIAAIKQSVREISPAKNTGISLGYSIFPDDGDTLEDLMKIADERMYEDKQNGKKHMGEAES